MSIYDEYQIVINEAQRRLIMRALTNAMANDRRSTGGGALSRPAQDEYMQLISLLSTLKPSLRK
jgi:hypothetical protein